MTHYRLTDDEPTAIVTVNGSEKKIYDNNQIYLNPDDNFEFRIFNPLQEVIGVEIILNGISSDSKLILNPGEDITIERFLDDKKKMKFSTYFIDDSNEKAKKAIEKNGTVEFKFYRKQINLNHLNLNGNIFRDPPCPTSYPRTNYPTYPDVWCGGSGNIYGTTFSTTSFNSESSDTKSFLETGRVAEGKESNQEFNSINIDLNNQSFHTIKYNLLPQSQQKTEIRNYCSECGLRIKKKSWKFCPKCGEEL